MKAKRIKTFIISMIFAFESIAAGYAPVNAQTVSENSVVTSSDIVQTPENASVKYSGTDGDLTWSIDTAGFLSVTGTGEFENIQPAWTEFATEIKTAKVSVTGISSLANFFYDCSALSTVDLSGLDTSEVYETSYMFYGCSSLKSVDLSTFETNELLEINQSYD